jgi:hypothetical protein
MYSMFKGALVLEPEPTVCEHVTVVTTVLDSFPFTLITHYGQTGRHSSHQGQYS